jgi:hypothetical protein
MVIRHSALGDARYDRQDIFRRSAEHGLTLNDDNRAFNQHGMIHHDFQPFIIASIVLEREVLPDSDSLIESDDFLRACLENGG